nr:MAG TPA: Glycine rich protein family [Caudoviricetes sp.]
MMESNNKSTNDQRTNELRAFRDLIMAALIFIAVLAALVLIFSSIGQNAKDLEARCKSLGGVAGQTKCFKNGQEI